MEDVMKETPSVEEEEEAIEGEAVEEEEETEKDEDDKKNEWTRRSPRLKGLIYITNLLFEKVYISIWMYPEVKVYTIS